MRRCYKNKLLLRCESSITAAYPIESCLVLGIPEHICTLVNEVDAKNRSWSWIPSVFQGNVDVDMDSMSLLACPANDRRSDPAVKARHGPATRWSRWTSGAWYSQPESNWSRMDPVDPSVFAYGFNRATRSWCIDPGRFRFQESDLLACKMGQETLSKMQKVSQGLRSCFRWNTWESQEHYNRVSDDLQRNKSITWMIEYISQP